MLSLLNNSFNSRPRLGIPLLGQGKLAFDQQGQDDSDPLAEHADQPIPSGAFRASLVNVVRNADDEFGWLVLGVVVW